MAQAAVGTKNLPLASAVLALLNKIPSKDRPIDPAKLAVTMKLDDYEKVRESIKLGDARLQGTLVAVRTWQSSRSNPLNTV